MITLVRVHKDASEYITLVESVRRNAARHRANAERHNAAGRNAYAVGSLRKAEKNDATALHLNKSIFADVL